MWPYIWRYVAWSGPQTTSIWHLEAMTTNCLCGTWQVSTLCRPTLTMWQQWKQSHGHHTSTDCWPVVVALQIAVYDSGTRWLVSHFSVSTLAPRFATWLGPNTQMNWWVAFVTSLCGTSFCHISNFAFRLFAQFLLVMFGLWNCCSATLSVCRSAHMVTHRTRSLFGSTHPWCR